MSIRCSSPLKQSRNWRTSETRPVSMYLTHVVGPVAVGTTIYLLFRTETLLVFQWVEVLGIGTRLAELRQASFGIELPAWLLFSFPDGVWVYAATSWLVLIWRPSICWPWVLLPVTLAVGSEVGQALAVIPGTYETCDIGFYIVGFLLAVTPRR